MITSNRVAADTALGNSNMERKLEEMTFLVGLLKIDQLVAAY